MSGSGGGGPRNGAPSRGGHRDRVSVSPARAAAFAVLRRLRTTRAHLDDSLASLPEFARLEPRDRALANELVIGTVKRRGSLDAVLSTVVTAPLARTDPDVRDALRLAAFQLLFLDRVPAYAVVDDAVTMVRGRGAKTSGFVNAVLRRIAGEGGETLARLSEGDGVRAWSVRLSCPQWLVRLVRRDLGDEAAARFLAAADEPPERCLRVNRLRGGREEARAALVEAGYTTAGVPGLPDALLYDGPPLETSEPFRAGLVTPQSRGSQVAGHVAAGGAARPGAAVLDLCAAPGTKTTQLLALLPESTLTAVEVDPQRAEALRQNLTRLGAERASVVCGDALDLPPSWRAAFDAVLLDAPCSGLGTLGSRADLRWRRQAPDVPRLAALQAGLLESAAAAVRPGGVLTYAVCTVTRAETLDVVGALTRTGRWEADDLGKEWPALAHPAAGGYLLALPPDAGSAGFFIARLRRAAE